MEKLELGKEKDLLMIPNLNAHLWNTGDNVALGVRGFFWGGLTKLD